MVQRKTHGSSDSTSIGAVLYESGPMKHALRSRQRGSVQTRMHDLPISIFLDSNGDLGFDDGIDTSNLVGDFPRALEE